MHRFMLATVTRVTIAVIVTELRVADVDAASSSGRSDISITATDTGEMARINGLEIIAIVSSNERFMVLRVWDVRPSKLVVKSSTVISEGVIKEYVVIQAESVLSEVGAIDNGIEVVITNSRTPELPEVSTIKEGNVTKGL